MSPVAIVTGAGSGIGRASAQALLAAGYSVALSGRKRSALEGTAAADNPAVLLVPTDVTDETSVERLFSLTLQRWGRVDVLFNNAGTFGPRARIDETSSAEWRDLIDVNVTGYFLCARAAFSRMRHQDPQGGRIINNGSLSAHAPRGKSPAYTASKHAITGLTKALALDGREFGIACGQIDIGNAYTPLIKETLEREGVDGQPAEPMFDASHAAAAVVFMATLPLEVNVQWLTILATKMPFAGRG